MKSRGFEEWFQMKAENSTRYDATWSVGMDHPSLKLPSVNYRPNSRWPWVYKYIRMVSCYNTFIIPEIASRDGLPALLTAEKAAFVEELAVTLHFLGVVNGPLASATLVSSSPVWHCCFFFLKRGRKMISDQTAHWKQISVTTLYSSISRSFFHLREYVEHSCRGIWSKLLQGSTCFKILGNHFNIPDNCFQLLL